MQSKYKKVLNQIKILRITAFLAGFTYTKSKPFKKTISKSSLNFHVYWDAMYKREFFTKLPVGRGGGKFLNLLKYFNCLYKNLTSSLSKYKILC